MKHPAALLCALLLALLLPQEGQAHRVNIFAYADGDAVQVECSFSKSQRVRSGRLTMYDAQTGEVLSDAVTDERGFFRYVPAADFLKSGHGLKILLNAGEGHQNSWTLGPEDLRMISGGEVTVPPDPSSAVRGTPPPVLPAPAAMPASEIEKRLEDMLEAKLAPMRQMLGKVLAAQQDDSPRLRDIIGGIGWIIGLLGMAAFARSKKC
ncbi:MAG: hypothetical protein IKS68_00295 [Mailhella sp.]|nr:hypothetical protein [Mailhella sp.]